MPDPPAHNTNKRVTLVDVARAAGVSRATASLVLRGSPRVAAPTQARVREAMERLGYVYNRAAASLRAQRSKAIGLVVTDITNPFFAELAVSIESRLDQAAHTVLLTHSADRVAKQDHLLQALHGYQVDGLLLCPAHATPEATLHQLRAWRLPFVLVTRNLAPVQADYVGADNRQGAAQAVDHLVGLGHQHIAFVGGPAEASARQERLAGFVEALENHGLAAPGRWQRESEVSRQGGFEAMAALLAEPEPPTAALCFNDVIAFGALHSLQHHGYAPGQNFALVGFDDVADAALVRPGLTTVAIHPDALGAAAVDVLLRRMSNPNSPPEKVILRPQLVQRDSCCAFPRT